MKVTVTTNVLPPLGVDFDAAPSQGGGGVGDFFLGLVRPRLVAETPLGNLDKAPWGNPRDGVWMLVLGTLAAGLVVLGWLVVRGLRRGR